MMGEVAARNEAGLNPSAHVVRLAREQRPGELPESAGW
jgi:hypothetical protein